VVTKYRAEIAKLLQEFFRDLDVVPSDVFAGIVLLRRHQKIGMRHVVAQVRILMKTSEDWYETCCNTGKNCYRHQKIGMRHVVAQVRYQSSDVFATILTCATTCLIPIF
jgi:hypothetical protein